VRPLIGATGTPSGKEAITSTTLPGKGLGQAFTVTSSMLAFTFVYGCSWPVAGYIPDMMSSMIPFSTK
jgi:hypothetical protein